MFNHFHVHFPDETRKATPMERKGASHCIPSVNSAKMAEGGRGSKLLKGSKYQIQFGYHQGSHYTSARVSISVPPDSAYLVFPFIWSLNSSLK
jgi:hypothetical protein